MTNQLPGKPSELLELALSDLAKVERSSKYNVSMGNWHSPTRYNGCHVCMAGAVMAKTLEAVRFKEHVPGDFETDTKMKLRALDYFRAGWLDLALTFLGIDLPQSLARKIDVADYHENRRDFKKDMRSIIKALEHEGL